MLKNVFTDLQKIKWTNKKQFAVIRNRDASLIIVKLLFQQSVVVMPSQ